MKRPCQTTENTAASGSYNASEASDTVGTELQFGPLERPVRLSRPRLQTFNYRGLYAYHVVVVTNQRARIFEDIELGRWCIGILEDVGEAAHFELLAYCLMPDHLHLLAQGNDERSHLITFMQRFKRRTGFHFKQSSGDRLWQSSYFDRVLREEEDLAETAEYIFRNPIAEGLCEDPEDYPLLGGTFAAATAPGPN